MFSSYIELDSTAGVINPYYARIRRLADGKYMLLWQMGVTPSDGNGKSTYYAVSYDLSHWKYMGCLWECQNVTNSRNEEDLKCFTNADVIQLRNGDIMAVDNRIRSWIHYIRTIIHKNTTILIIGFFKGMV